MTEVAMSLLNVVLIAVGLSMDALAVSIACGISTRNIRKRDALKVALFFGVFQAVMPVLGWLGGRLFSEAISSFDHWVVFGLLAFIGGKMVWESRKLACEDDEAKDYLSTPRLLLLAFATSVDALAIGLSFALLQMNIALPVVIIGLITLAICFVGVLAGKKLGCMFEKRAELFGGLVLIGIGLKILLEHLLGK